MQLHHTTNSITFDRLILTALLTISLCCVPLRLSGAFSWPNVDATGPESDKCNLKCSLFKDIEAVAFGSKMMTITRNSNIFWFSWKMMLDCSSESLKGLMAGAALLTDTKAGWSGQGRNLCRSQGVNLLRRGQPYGSVSTDWILLSYSSMSSVDRLVHYMQTKISVLATDPPRYPGRLVCMRTHPPGEKPS